MTQPIPADATTPIPLCAGPAPACPAMTGRAVTCPAQVQRGCATLARLRGIAAPAESRSYFSGAGAAGATA
jgi:hypothetical protein